MDVFDPFRRVARRRAIGAEVDRPRVRGRRRASRCGRKATDDSRQPAATGRARRSASGCRANAPRARWIGVASLVARSLASAAGGGPCSADARALDEQIASWRETELEQLQGRAPSSWTLPARKNELAERLGR